MTECRTIGISIDRDPDAVYEFLADPRSFPKWSNFITTMKKDGAAWIAQTPGGSVRIRFTPKNRLRVLDHEVRAKPGQKILVPMRVLPNQERGSEVIFSVFRQPGMSAKQYEKDIKMVSTDLKSLKRFLEHEHKA